MAKKKNITMYLLVGFLVVLGIFAVFPDILNIAFPGAIGIKCGSLELGKLSCTLGNGSPEGLISDTEQFVEFTIDNPSNLYVKNFESIFKPVLLRDNPEVSDFFANSYCKLNGASIFYNSDSFMDECNYIQGCSTLPSFLERYHDSVLELSLDTPASSDCIGISDQGSTNYKLVFILSSAGIANHQFDNQAIIVEGTLVEKDSGFGAEEFKTYGFCNMYTGVCNVRVPDVYSLNTELPLKAVISSIVINLKTGGYTKEQICNEFDAGCVSSCTQASDCGQDGPVLTPWCSESGNSEQFYSTYSCEQGKCVESTDLMVTECQGGCEFGKCKGGDSWIMYAVIGGVVLIGIIFISAYLKMKKGRKR